METVRLHIPSKNRLRQAMVIAFFIIVLINKSKLTYAKTIGDYNFEKYDGRVTKSAGHLFNPIIYDFLIKGAEPEALVEKTVTHLHNKGLLALLDYIFETVIIY